MLSGERPGDDADVAEREPVGNRAPRGPLVTVVVPAYNAAATLAATLRSASEQSHEALEILIVDDASTDETADIARRFCEREPRARLLQQKVNRGVSAARNRAIREARGDYVATLDADDLWHREKIERQLEALLEAPEPPGFVYTLCRRIDGMDRVVGQDLPCRVDGAAFAQLAYRNFASTPSTILARRAVLLEVDGFDEGQHVAGLDGNEDLLLQLMIARTRPVLCVPEYLVGYRLTPNSMSTHLVRMQRSWLRVAAFLRREHCPAPARVFAWAAGRTWFGIAVSRLRRRQPLGAAACAARALWCDPVRTLLQIGHSARRATGRLLLRPPPARHLPLFESCDPGAAPPHSSWPAPSRTSWLERLDRSRMERLRRLDATLAGPARPTADGAPAANERAPAVQGAGL